MISKKKKEVKNGKSKMFKYSNKAILNKERNHGIRTIEK